jgi:hypothetical protein
MFSFLHQCLKTIPRGIIAFNGLDGVSFFVNVYHSSGKYSVEDKSSVSY